MLAIKGDVIEGVVSGLASGGEGVIKIDGYPVFVPYAIKGESVRAKIVYSKKDCAFGELVEILEMSEERVKPVCPYFERCGGCDLQHMSSILQQNFKRDEVKAALKKIAGQDVDVAPVTRANEFEYRNKLSLPFSMNKHSGRVSLGFYERRSHKVVPVKWCAVSGEWAATLIEVLTTWATENRISVYDETTGQGLLRHASARMLDSLCLTLVINGDSVPKTDILIERLKEKFGDFVLYISPNKARTNVIFGDRVERVYGEDKEQNLGKFKAKISPKSFLQVNCAVMDLIYDGAAEELGDFDGEIVELYSGVGLLTCQLALRLKNSKITSVEIERSASDDANALIYKLGLNDRVTALCGDALEYMRGIKNESGARKALILDPPRRGCDREVLEGAIAAGFERIIYISCNPQTLARDVKILGEAYEPTSVRPFDMFPQTADVECLTTLQKI